MDTFLIMRRGGFASPKDLEQAAERSTAEGDKMPGEIRWIRSYVTEDEGRVGTVCVYQASSEEAIRRHAAGAELPVDEVVKVADTVVVREDPAPAATA